MKTVVETEVFRKQADRIWSEEERLELISYVAQNPKAGEVIPNAEGARKLRWTVKGRGKRGGARVIYINITQETLYLLAVYLKTERENLSTKQIKQVTKSGG